MANKKMSGIYCIENIVNHKKYIGQAVNIQKRFGRHRRELKNGVHPNKYLQNSYEKYGVENFKYFIIQECERDAEILGLMETYWIVYYNSHVMFGEGYNMNFGGKGPLGSIPWNKGKPVSEEVKEKISNSLMGSIVSTETKEKISQTRMGKYTKEENGMYGKHMSDESKEKLSRTKQGNKKGRKSTSKYSGVYRNSKDAGKIWTACIFCEKRSLYLGTFYTEEEAALAYNKKALEIYGENARINIIEDIGENKNECDNI